MPEATSFKNVLLDVAGRIAARETLAEIDQRTLWQAFLYLANTGHAEALDALRSRFGETKWDGAYPLEINAGPDRSLPLAADVKRLFGPLSPLGKKFGGDLTPQSFLAILEEVDAFAQLRLVATATRTHDTPGDGVDTVQKPSVGRPLAADPERRPTPPRSHPRKALADAVSVLQQRLESHVFGQTSAVRAFIDGLRTSLDRPHRKGVFGGSFLIFGPHGSGKGELLRILEDWVREYKSHIRLKDVVYCEGYLRNALPTLRDRIRESPPSFLVLNEFEKHEPELRDILMEGMSRAVLQLPDRDLGGKLEPTDVSGWVVILTGNVGRALWGRLPFKEKEILPDRERIKELLEREAIADPHRKNEVFSRTLSRAFLDRIDYFIPLAQLRYADAHKILDREVQRLRDELKQQHSASLEIEPRVLDLVILASYYKRGWSGRQALRGFGDHIESPSKKALLEHGSRTITMSSADRTFNNALKHGTPRILVIDDQWQTLCKVLSEGLRERAKVVGFPDVAQALHGSAEPFDLLLLDLYFDGQPLWKEYLHRWRTAQPETPVVLASDKVVSSADRLEIDRLGGVIGFLGKSPDPDAMAASLEPFLLHASWQAKIRAFEQAYGHGGDRVLFDLTVRNEGDLAKIRFSDVQCVVAEGTMQEGEEPVLSSATRHDVEEFLSLFLDPGTRATYGIDQPRGLLLYGPPGNGKTMIARSLARRMRCNFLAVGAGDFQSRWAGVAAERLKELFEQARMRQPCVVFVDEIDAVAPRRVEETGGGLLRDQAATVATLLAELDGFGGRSEVFIIGATNRKDSIDPAVLRPGRIDRQICVGPPGKNERKALLERLLLRHLGSVDLDWAASETYGLGCAEISRCIQDAAILAWRRTRSAHGVGESDPLLTALDLREAIDRLRHGERGDPEVARTSRELRAWHEAGHLVLDMALLGEIPARVTIVPRGDVGGFVRRSEEDVTRRGTVRRRSECLAEIATLLGAGVSEELRFGEHSTGVSGDRRAAVMLANDMVVRAGMGPVDAEVAGNLAEQHSPGDGTVLQVAGQAVDHRLVEAIAALIEEATALAKRELQVRRADLERAASLLMLHEEMARADIEREFGHLLASRPDGHEGTVHAPEAGMQ